MLSGKAHHEQTPHPYSKLKERLTFVACASQYHFIFYHMLPLLKTSSLIKVGYM